MLDEQTFVRRELQGLNYYAFLRRYFAARRPRNYLEIGVCHGKSFMLAECPAIGVDPAPELRGDIVGGKPHASVFRMTSDDFFATGKLAHLFPDGVDLAFLDGMHLFEFLLRDFINTERHARPDGTILLHDCLPINAEMAERERRPALRRDAAYKTHWTGDVWKVVFILKRHRPDLRITVLDSQPTGLTIVENLDPASEVLARDYDRIVSEYLDEALTDETLFRVADGLGVESADAWLDAFEARHGAR